MYDHIGTLWHKVADKDGRLHNGIYVARQKHILLTTWKEKR